MVWPSAENSSHESKADTEEGLFFNSNGADGDDDDIFGDIDSEPDRNRMSYDEDAEPLPNEAAYDEEFAQIPEKVHKLLKDIMVTIGMPNRERDCFRYMFQEAERLRRLPSMQKRRINLVGKSGSGKTSLLNSMLGRPDAAKALSAGEGCTEVPTSYESPLADQIYQCAADVVFLSPAEIRKKLALLLDMYFLWHFSEHDWPGEEDGSFQEDARTAYKTFRGLFGKKRNGAFANQKTGEKFLKEAYGRSKSTVVDQMLQWCQELMPWSPKMPGTLALVEDHCATKRFEAETERELREQVESYAFSNTTHNKPSLTALVKCIHVGLEGVRILRYATFTDWPGVDDTNRLRASASTDRIHDCDELWIVSSATRICSEPTVLDLLTRYGRIKPCLVVCTHLDFALDEAFMDEMRRRGRDTRSHDSILAEKVNYEKKLSSIHKKLDRLDDIISNGYLRVGGNKRRAMDSKDIVGMKQKLKEEEQPCSEALAELDQKCFAAKAMVRKENVNALLDERMAEYKRPDAEIKLAFVSNEHYMINKGAKAGTDVLLSPEETGMPWLRHHVLSSAAPSTLRAVQTYVNHSVAVLLEGIGLVVDPTDHQGCKQALAMIADKKIASTSWQRAHINQLSKAVDEELVAPLKENISQFRHAGLDIISSKARWLYPSIRAFVLRDGRHGTKRIPPHSWNAEFLEAAAEVVEDKWETFAEKEACAFEIFQQKLVEECLDIEVQMSGSSAQYRLPEKKFSNFIQAQSLGVKSTCQLSRLAFDDRMRNIRIEATIDDCENPTGYFAQAMQPVWKQSQQTKGTGAKKGVITAFETHMLLEGERSPYALLANSLNDAIIANGQAQVEEVGKSVDTILDDTTNWVKLAFKRQSTDRTDLEIQDRLKSVLPGVQSDFRRIQAELNEIEWKYRTSRRT